MTEIFYFQHIWSTLMNSFNFRGKAGRTEYAYFMLFLISCTILLIPLCFVIVENPKEISEIKISPNYLLLYLYCGYFIFLLCIWFSTIALTFRRCHDIGLTMLVLIPCMGFVVGGVGVLDIWGLSYSEYKYLSSVLLYISIVTLPVFSLFLIFVKGKANLSKITENNAYFLFTGIKKRYIVFAVVTIALLIFLFAFHFNYEYTDWWIEEWIIICNAIAAYLVIIALYYIIILWKLFWHNLK